MRPQSSTIALSALRQAVPRFGRQQPFEKAGHAAPRATQFSGLERYCQHESTIDPPVRLRSPGTLHRFRFRSDIRRFSTPDGPQSATGEKISCATQCGPDHGQPRWPWRRERACRATEAHGPADAHIVAGSARRAAPGQPPGLFRRFSGRGGSAGGGDLLSTVADGFAFNWRWTESAKRNIRQGDRHQPKTPPQGPKICICLGTPTRQPGKLTPKAAIAQLRTSILLKTQSVARIPGNFIIPSRCPGI